MTKEYGKMIANASLDLKTYGSLLLETTPKIIENDQEYEYFLSLAEELLEKGQNKTLEEKSLLKLLLLLIEEYEEKNFQLKATSPNELVKHLMEAKNLKPKDLIPLFNSSGYASDIINGKRPISLDIAKKLGNFFNIDPSLFLF